MKCLTITGKYIELQMHDRRRPKTGDKSTCRERISLCHMLIKNTQDFYR